MALFKFTNKILNNKEIEVYNKGRMNRSFTYIDDAIKILIKIILKIQKNKKNMVPFNIVNLGSKKTINLNKFIKILEKNLRKKSTKSFYPFKMVTLFRQKHQQKK